MKSKLIIIFSVVFVLIGIFFAFLGMGIISFTKENEPILYELSEKVKIGDYVNYDAGSWEEEGALSSEISSFTFGGYTKDVSRNNGVNCGYHELKNVGWRVFRIEDGQITLIQAGLSMCYYHGYGSGTNEKSVNILSGEDENINFDEFFYDDFAESVKILSKDDVDEYYQSDSGFQRIEDDLIRVGNPYWLASKYGSYYMWYVTEGGTVAVDHVGAYGVRVLVTLKKGVKTSGQDENQIWILAKDEKKDE